MGKEEESEGRSLAETPTWAVATVVTIMVILGFFFQGSLKRFGKFLDRTKRKSLLASLEKIKEELMLFGLLSLLMGHWIVFVAKICVRRSVLSSSRFFPCALDGDIGSFEHILLPVPQNSSVSLLREQLNDRPRHHNYCPEGRESFASQESLEELHRFLFVLGITHVSYSFAAIALAMIKIISWRIWEQQAKEATIQASEGSPPAASNTIRMRRLSTFIFNHASHPWSQNRFLVWLLCFSRQFWSSISRADYMALRLGFITTHELPLSYDFHNYMLRSMEEEFRDIVGISIPLWIYAILCIFLDFHGTHIYFWVSFLPAILILLIGTKLHRVVVKLAVEIMDTCPSIEGHTFKLSDDLFWFGKPKFLLLLIQLVTFQNAFEMATFIWSMWEIREPSCFMENHRFLVTRLTFGVVSQIWCSFITFPLYVIITQMGSKFNKSLISENVRRSLHGWRKRVKARKGSSHAHMSTTSLTSLDSSADDTNTNDDTGFTPESGETSTKDEAASMSWNQTFEISPCDDDSYSGDGNDDGRDVKDRSFLLPLH